MGGGSSVGWFLLVGAAWSVACGPELSRFRVMDGAAQSDASGDGASFDGSPADAGSADGARMDGAMPTDAGAGDAFMADRARPDGGATECGRPQLLASVEDLTNLDRTGGRVLRFELDAELEGWRRCSDLTARGVLQAQPTAVGVFPDGIVVIAGWYGVEAIDPRTDSVVWTEDRDSQQADNVAVVTEPSAGETRAVVSWLDQGTPPGIRELTAYDGTGRRTHTWSSLEGNLPFGPGNVRAVAVSPLHAGRLVGAHRADYAAAEIDLFGGSIFDSPSYVRSRSGLVLRSLQALTKDGEHILTWTGTLDSFPGVFHVVDSDGSPDRSILGPTECEGRDDPYADAIADPTTPGVRFIAVAGTGRAPDLVRFGPSSSLCEVAFAGGELGNDYRISGLAIWP